jgi:formate hydrogenlyase transcriptional activator
VHRLSDRRDRTFVKLNCAAIPTGLLESELFGHERGAFTGAVERRLGRFELADGGTLFLDEVGDIPPDLQPKLLRVLQEQEFERIGSGKTIKVDVRLVAATHRNLGKMVSEGRFRADLFYRLHVFPIPLPPLRDRKDDIPLLVRHFARLFAQRTGKAVSTIPDETMERFRSYEWPGNIRELEHLIERAVILSPGSELRVPPFDTVSIAGTTTEARTSVSTSLKDAEREMIRRVLEDCHWRIGGPQGAAVRLGMKRTTLLSRMKRLGLERPVNSKMSNK